MLKLFIANKNYSSWSLRPWVLMRELGMGFEEALVPFPGPGEPSAFTGFSPSGRVPCLMDGDTVVWDSLAIIEYLAEREPRVWPADPKRRAWARSAAAEMHSGFPVLREVCTMNCGVRVRLFQPPPALTDELARLEDVWGQGLARSGGPFLGGVGFSAVDAFFCPVAFRVQTYGLRLSPLSTAYVERLLALRSMQDWYRSALAEHWRDAAHEGELLRAGAVLQDLRTVRA